MRVKAFLRLRGGFLASWLKNATALAFLTLAAYMWCGSGWYIEGQVQSPRSKAQGVAAGTTLTLNLGLWTLDPGV